jgi:L-fuconolactonase
MSVTDPGSDEWLAQVNEEIIDEDRPIIDPHHHLWKSRFNRNYLLPELWSDTGSGHNIIKTVFMECHAFYLREGPEHLRPIGETQYISDLAKKSSASGNKNATIAGIVAHADLTLAGRSEELLNEILDQHQAIAGELFKGVRHSAARDKRPEDLFIVSGAPNHLHRKKSFRQGIKVLANRKLTYDTWHYHHQNLDFLDLARAFPDCTMILNHFGTPLGVGTYRSSREQIFQRWKEDIAELAKCENVYAKLGGLAMPDNGFDWHLGQRPPSSNIFIPLNALGLRGACLKAIFQWIDFRLTTIPCGMLLKK